MSDFWYLVCNDISDINVSYTTIFNSHVSGSSNFYSLYRNQCLNGGGNEGWIWDLTIRKLEIKPKGSLLRIGNSMQLKLLVTWTNGWVEDVTTSSSWLSSNNDIVNVTTGGLATSLSHGNVQVSTTYNGVTAYGFITVSDIINERDNDDKLSFNIDTPVSDPFDNGYINDRDDDEYNSFNDPSMYDE